MKKNGSRALEVCAHQIDIFATPCLPVVTSNETTSGNIIGDADIPILKAHIIFIRLFDFILDRYHWWSTYYLYKQNGGRLRIKLARNLNNIMRSGNLNDGDNYVYFFLVLTLELLNFLINLQWVL